MWVVSRNSTPGFLEHLQLWCLDSLNPNYIQIYLIMFLLSTPVFPVSTMNGPRNSQIWGLQSFSFHQGGLVQCLVEDGGSSHGAIWQWTMAMDWLTLRGILQLLIMNYGLWITVWTMAMNYGLWFTFHYGTCNGLWKPVFVGSNISFPVNGYKYKLNVPVHHFWKRNGMPNEQW